MGNDHYDVLVIGSGPGGATTGARVAETGKRVLLLERGDFLPRERDNPFAGRSSRDYPTLRCSTSRVSRSCPTGWTAGPAPVSPADRRAAHPGRGRPGHPRSRGASGATGWTGSRAWSGQGGRGMGGDPGAGRASQPDADDADHGRPVGRRAGRSVTGVAMTLPDGSTSVFTADIVVLSAGAILSAALLLSLGERRHPHGLANSSDASAATTSGTTTSPWSRSPGSPTRPRSRRRCPSTTSTDPGQDWEYPMGNIQMLGKSDAWQVKGAAPHRRGWARHRRTAWWPATRPTSGWPARTSRGWQPGHAAARRERSDWHCSRAITPRA